MSDSAAEFFATDQQGRLIHCGRGAFELTGLDDERVIGRQAADVLGLTFEDGVSAPGKYVELRAERAIVVLISNCPQLNNPCNGWDPTPIRLLGWWPV